MLCYYNVHVSDDRGKFSRFPEHHWVASSMIYALYPTAIFSIGCNSLDVSVWSSAVYFNELCCILTSPQGEKKYKQRLKYTAILHTETSNKRYIIQLNLFLTFFSNLKELQVQQEERAHGTVQ